MKSCPLAFRSPLRDKAFPGHTPGWRVKVLAEPVMAARKGTEVKPASVGWRWGAGIHWPCTGVGFCKLEYGGLEQDKGLVAPEHRQPGAGKTLHQTHDSGKWLSYTSCLEPLQVPRIPSLSPAGGDKEEEQAWWHGGLGGHTGRI